LFELYFVLASLAAGAALLWLDMEPSLIAPLILLPYLGRNLFHLARLARLIRRHHRMTPPFPRGLWGEIYRAVAQYQQRGRKRRKRQIRFFRRFREAAISVPDALVVLDKRWRIEWANPAAEVMMNVRWPRDEGKPLTEILDNEEIEELIATGEYSRPAQMVPAHNRAMVLSVHFAPIGERKRQRLVVGRDITKVFHLNMIRRDFAANASHELRTPLTVIAGFIENLVDSPLTPESHRRPMRLMCNQAERMRSIIEDLLTLSRLEMEDLSPHFEPVDVPDELHRILDEARLLSAGGHELIADIDPELMLSGSVGDLRSAFSNLVVNAVKHTPQGSRIRITWTKDESGPLLAVADNGGGIAPEHIPRLTERFYRIDKARSRASGGTGLGLAIVNHVLNRHGARLIVESEIGQGSIFTCRFPKGTGLDRSQLREEDQTLVASSQTT
jgi:two-component system phosphate regulon sensor histidine kinase PhoR